MENTKYKYVYVFLITTTIAMLFVFMYRLIEPTITGIQKYEIKGFSMYTPYEEGDIVEVNTKYEQIKRFDVVVFQQAHEGKQTTMIKRVVGLPNEEITYKDSTLYINGKQKEEPYTDSLYYLTQDLTYKNTEDCVYVLGDNRRNSIDSRVYGCVDISAIDGVVVDEQKNEK